MASPPLAPDEGPIDLGHLKRMTLGDAGLSREVLAMFSLQAGRLVEMLASRPEDVETVAHTLKGSAQAIGAFAVADAAQAVAAHRGEPAEAIATLKQAVAEARAAIEAMLGRS
jgi:HPt (histidine-containing phosphotransfer) domain-containing protein